MQWVFGGVGSGQGRGGCRCGARGKHRRPLLRLHDASELSQHGLGSSLKGFLLNRESLSLRSVSYTCATISFGFPSN